MIRITDLGGGGASSSLLPLIMTLIISNNNITNCHLQGIYHQALRWVRYVHFLITIM